MIRGVLLPLLPLITVLGCIFGGWVARGMWEREQHVRDVLEGRVPAPWERANGEIPAGGYARSGDGEFWPEVRRGIFDDELGKYV